MPRATLFLGLVPLGKGESIFARPIRVYYRTAKDSRIEYFDPKQSSWKFLQSQGYYRETNELLNRLQDTHVEGKTLAEFVSYDGVSMWQFLPSYIWPSFFLAVQLTDVVCKIVEDTAPGEIHVFPVSDYTARIWDELVRSIGRIYGVPVVSANSIGWRRMLRRRLRRIGLGRLVLQVRRIPQTLSFAYEQAKRRNKITSGGGSARVLLFLTLGRRHWLPNPSDPAHKYDEQIYPLLPALRRCGWRRFVSIDCQDSDRKELEKRNQPDLRWQRFSSYRSVVDPTFGNARAVFAGMFEVLKSDPEFQSGLCYRKVCLASALEDVMQKAFTQILPECARMLTIAKRMLNQEQPGALIATYETGPWTRAVIIQAARAGIPTIGLQHGALVDSPDYMHRHITTDPIADPSGFVVPRITCVWGAAWKRELTKKGHYPPGAVVVTGSWRHDHLTQIAGSEYAPRMRRSLGYSDGKKVVLILSSGFGVLYYLRKCLEVIASRADLTPLIKLHPGVDDPKPVRDMLGQLGYPETILTEGQLGQAMLPSDLVISQISTVVSEAAIFEKPVILVNFGDFPYADLYVNQGICLYVTDPADLPSAIEKAINDQRVVAKMTAAQREFVSQFFFRIDGCASQRVVKALEAAMARGSRV